MASRALPGVSGLLRLASVWRTPITVAGTVVLSSVVVAVHLQAQSAGWVLLALFSSIGLAVLVIRAGIGAGIAIVSQGLHRLANQPVDWSTAVMMAGLYVVVRSERRRWPWLSASAAVIGIGLLRRPLWNTADVSDGAQSEVLVLTVAALLGELARRRNQRISALEERAAVLSRLRDVEAEVAVTGERARMARELHDVLAHAVSAIVVQAGAGRRAVRRRPADAEVAFATIESTGREAMAELRQMLATVRGPSGHYRAPSIDDLTPLIDQTAVAVRVVRTGTSVPIDPGIDLTAYRVVQEALTNVRKHAVGAREVVVELRWAPQALVIVIRDDGPGDAEPERPTQYGFGLLGMRERVLLRGGTLDAGPQPGGAGWQVRASLPLNRAEMEGI
jgi:signal transduction histidine kinase